MASSRAIRAARAFVEIFADDSKMRRTLKHARERVSAFGRSVSRAGGAVFGVAAAAAAPLLAAAFKFAKAGDVVDKISARTGVSAETISQLGFAAEQAGTNIETLEKGFFGLSRAYFDAGRGTLEAVEAFEILGHSVESLEGLSPEEMFLEMADGLAGVEDMSKRGAIAQKIFGRAGRQLLPMLAGGAEGLKEMREEADRLGLTLDTKQARSAAQFTDAWNRVKRTLGGAMIQIGAALAPLLIRLSNTVANFVARLIEWVRANQGLIRAVTAGVGVMAAFGAGVLVLGVTISGAASALGLMMSPFGLLIGLAAAAGIALTQFGDEGAAALNWLAATFEPLTRRAVEAFGAIKDALSAGEYQLAAKVLWLGLKEAWLSGTAALREAWIGFGQVFLSTLDGFLTSARKKWSDWQGAIADKMIDWMGVFDSSLDVGEIKATRREDTERRIRTIDEGADARKEARESRTSAAMAAIQAEISAARAELKGAQGEAHHAALAAEAVADAAADARAALLEEEATTDKAVGRAAVSATAGGDLRSVAGAGLLVQLLNKPNTIEQQSLTVLQQLKRLQRQLLDATKDTRRTVEL